MADARAWLVRKRVPLGFVAALAALIAARPTWGSWIAGLAVASIGEAIRIWAAGHLEKSREVTQSGPYRYTRHPLYLGSTILAVGIVVASRSVWVAAVAAVYIGVTIPMAIRAEERFLREKFGDAPGARGAVTRRFSMERALRNREYRAVLGLIGGFAVLALKALLL